MNIYELNSQCRSHLLLARNDAYMHHPTAKKLIESTIEKGRLSPDALNNQDYVDAVETQL